MVPSVGDGDPSFPVNPYKGGYIGKYFKEYDYQISQNLIFGLYKLLKSTMIMITVYYPNYY